MEETSFNYGILLLLLAVLTAVAVSNIWLRRRAESQGTSEVAANESGSDLRSGLDSDRD